MGIVGCGRVAAHHLRFISEAPGVSLVGLADKDKETARRFAETYSVGEVHSSIEDMLEKAAPDVLHILTSPFLHYAQASVAIERGGHVFVEKPVALQAAETEALYQRAAARGISLCADFIQLFHPAFLKARAIVESGHLGRVVYVESFFESDTGHA